MPFPIEMCIRDSDNPIRNYNLNDYYKNIPDKQGEGEVGFSVRCV